MLAVVPATVFIKRSPNACDAIHQEIDSIALGPRRQQSLPSSGATGETPCRDSLFRRSGRFRLSPKASRVTHSGVWFAISKSIPISIGRRNDALKHFSAKNRLSKANCFFLRQGNLCISRSGRASRRPGRHMKGQ